MKISSIIDILDGELKSSPSISFGYNIKTNARKIHEGDFYITNHKKDIPLAIKNGAFAIIYDFETEILDNEIAWIKVSNTNDALIKLFRFKLSPFNLEVYYCDQITFDLLYIYKNSKKHIKLISSKIENSIKLLENIKESEILFCTNKTLLKKIYPNFKIFNKNSYNINNQIKHSLFETSFSYKDSFFHKLKISSLYINQFLDIYTFFDKEIDTKKIILLEHFKAIFIDKFLNIIEFGKSSRFVICQKDLSLVNNEIEFITKNYKYGKIVFITKEFINNLPQKQLVLKDIKKLKSILKNIDFNAIYIIGYEKSKIEKVLNNSSMKKLELF